MATITIYFQGKKLVDHPIDKLRLNIGRNADNDLVLADNKASGQHARVCYEKSHYVIEDLMSTNGSFYRGEKILRHICHEGDQIQIGNHVLHFHNLQENPPHTAGSKMRSNVAESLRQQAKEHTVFLENTTSGRSQEKKTGSDIGLAVIILMVTSLVAALGILVYFLLFYV